MAAQRPNLPIITAASNQRVANQLALIYGNSAFCISYSENYGYELAKELKKARRLKSSRGEKDLFVVIVSGDKDKAGTDTIKVRHV